MQVGKKLLVFVVCLGLWLGMLGAAAPESPLSRAGRYLTQCAKLSELPAGQSGCDWTATVLALSGMEEDYQGYLRRLEDYVAERYRQPEKLDSFRATEWHRIAITVTALGGDCRNFAGVDLVADGVYEYAGELGAQGANALIYALLTLDVTHTEPPAGSRYTRQALVESLLASQNEDGGFGLSGGSSSVDMTAMALQALASCRAQYPEAVDHALRYLMGCQNADGSFSDETQASCENTAQVILALTSLGLDPAKEPDFQKEGSPVSALLTFQDAGGGFVHLLGDQEADGISTTQAMLALWSLEHGALWDASNWPPVQQASGIGLLWLAPAGVLALAGVGIVLLRRKGGRCA